MLKTQTLRALVTERLTAAAEDILALFARTMGEYEEELRRSKEDIHSTQQQQRLEESHRAVLHCSIPPPCPGLHQDLTETPIKEEPAGQDVKQEEEPQPVEVHQAGRRAANTDSFLGQRGVSTELTQQMQQDHVDATVTDLMDDTRLAIYLPLIGDRLAAKRVRLENQIGSSTKDSCKYSLIDKFKHKMSANGKEDSNEMEQIHYPKRRQSHATNNKFASKKTRKIELGWIHDGRQVRKKKGGGTKTLDVPKEFKKADLLQLAKDIFFPQGKNSVGRFETFSCDIADYREMPVIDEDVTVGDLYEILKMGMLRVYLCTKSLPEDENGANGEETSEQTQGDVNMLQDLEDDKVALSDSYEVNSGHMYEDRLTDDSLEDALMCTKSYESVTCTSNSESLGLSRTIKTET